jgi:hypothetical protein
MPLISDAIFGEVGHNEATILIGTVHDLLKHVPVSLLLVSVHDHPWDSILKFDLGLSSPPRDCRALRRVASITFLFLCIYKKAGIQPIPWPTVDQVRRMMCSRSSHWLALVPGGHCQRSRGASTWHALGVSGLGRSFRVVDSTICSTLVAD